MRRTVVLILTLALLAFLPAVAGAKPDKPPKPEPPPERGPCEFDADGELVGYSGGELECIWTVDDLPSTWEITVTPSGEVRGVILTVRDNHPGDFCAAADQPGRVTGPVATGPFELPAEGPPDHQCVDFDGDGWPVENPNEFYVLLDAKTRKGSSVSVTAVRTG